MNMNFNNVNIQPIRIEDDDKIFFYPHAFFDNEKQILYVAYENSKQFWLKKIPFKDIS